MLYDVFQPMLRVMKQILKGIRGFVKDEDGAFVPNVTLRLNRSTFRSTARGEYWRVLLPEHSEHYYVTVRMKVHNPSK